MKRLHFSHKLLNILYCILLLVLFCIHIPELYQMYVLHDEFGYWANAALFAGYDWSGIASMSPYYSYGYSFLLVPFLLIFRNSIVMYRAAIFLNGLLYVGSFLLSFCCARRLFRRDHPCVLSTVCFFLTLYCNNLVQVNIAWTEALLYFLYWLMFYTLIRFCEERRLLPLACFALEGLFLYAVHQRSLGIVIAAVMAMLISFAAERHFRAVKASPADSSDSDKAIPVRSWRFYAKRILLLSAVLLSALAAAALVKNIMIGKLWKWEDTEIAGRNDFSGQWAKLSGVFASFGGFVKLVRHFCGKLLYLAVAGGSLFYWGVLSDVKNILGTVSTHGAYSADDARCTDSAHSTDSTYGTQSTHSTDGTYGTQSAHSIDGTHSDHDAHSTDSTYDAQSTHSIDGTYDAQSPHSTDGAYSDQRACANDAYNAHASHSANGNVYSRYLPVHLFLLLSLLGTVGIVSIYMGSGSRIDCAVYGRYIEFLAGPLLLLGCMYLYEKPPKLREFAVYGGVVLLTGLLSSRLFTEGSTFTYIMSVGSSLFYDGGSDSFLLLPCLGFALMVGLVVFLSARFRKIPLAVLSVCVILGYWWTSSENALRHEVLPGQKYVKNVSRIEEFLEAVDGDGEMPIYFVRNENVSDFFNWRIENLQFLMPGRRIQLVGREMLSSLSGDYFLIQYHTDNLEMERYCVVTQAHNLVVMAPVGSALAEKCLAYAAAHPYVFTDAMMYSATESESSRFDSDHVNGFLMFCQDLVLSPGVYRVDMELSVSEIEGDVLGAADVSFDYGSGLLYSAEVAASEVSADGMLRISYEFVCPSPAAGVEFRFYSHGNALLTLEHLEYSVVKVPESITPPQAAGHEI